MAGDRGKAGVKQQPGIGLGERIAQADARADALMAAAFAAADVGLCLVDADGRIAAANAVFCRIIGWPEGEVSGQLFSALLVDADPVQTPRRQVGSEHGARQRSTDRRIRAGDGAIVDINVSDGTTLTAGDREYTAVTVINISRRIRAETERANSIRLLRAALDTVPGLVNVKDRQSRYVFMNSYQARLYGVTAEDAIGKSAGDLLGRNYGDYTGALDRKVVENGAPVPFFEEEYPVASGEVHTFLTCKAPAFDTAGQVAHVVTVAIDVTEQKRAERSLIAMKDEAESANRSKSEFLANMSHELRTPLNAIIGFAEIIAEQMFGPVTPTNYRDYATNIHSAGSHLLAVINDILDMTRIEAGQARLQEERFDPASIVRSAISMVGVSAQLKGLELVRDMDDTVPLLVADPRKVKQMLINLLSNAIKFTESGRVTVQAIPLVSGELAIVVADTGIGIAAENMTKAMAPFGQVDGTLARRHQGTGLGLPLTRALIELHGGRLDLASRIGVGTEASLIFPPERVRPRD
jgi:PAS domain S-box-containing protein